MAEDLVKLIRGVSDGLTGCKGLRGFPARSGVVGSMRHDILPAHRHKDQG
jgi:hypothetical protein